MSKKDWEYVKEVNIWNLKRRCELADWKGKWYKWTGALKGGEKKCRQLMLFCTCLGVYANLWINPRNIRVIDSISKQITGK